MDITVSFWKGQFSASFFRDFTFLFFEQLSNKACHSALRHSLHAQGFAKISKNLVAPQKRDFPISCAFVLLTEGHFGCSMQQEQAESSISIKDLKLIFTWTTGSFSSCLSRQYENTSNLQQRFSFCTTLAFMALQLQTV